MNWINHLVVSSLLKTTFKFQDLKNYTVQVKTLNIPTFSDNCVLLFYKGLNDKSDCSCLSCRKILNLRLRLS